MSQETLEYLGWLDDVSFAGSRGGPQRVWRRGAAARRGRDGPRAHPPRATPLAVSGREVARAVGWPYSYFGGHVDARVKPPRPDLVASASRPDYALGPHTGSLGLASSTGAALAERFRDGMFVGQHGSWNRKPFSGYQVIFVPFSDGRPTGALPIPVLTGFLDDRGHARGRPVGVAVDGRGALLVADDVGNTIWRVSKAP